jgi:hypothetical protein
MHSAHAEADSAGPRTIAQVIRVAGLFPCVVVVLCVLLLLLLLF